VGERPEWEVSQQPCVRMAHPHYNYSTAHLLGRSCSARRPCGSPTHRLRGCRRNGGCAAGRRGVCACAQGCCAGAPVAGASTQHTCQDPVHARTLPERPRHNLSEINVCSSREDWRRAVWGVHKAGRGREWEKAGGVAMKRRSDPPLRQRLLLGESALLHQACTKPCSSTTSH
jgi:hypothetical protein